MSILRKVLPSGSRQVTIRDLIRLESKIGGRLFGPIPKGHRREFFCLDEHTWVWYEEIIDSKTGQRTSMTTRYEIRGNKIIKIQDGQPYRYTSLEESKNLLKAIEQYYQQISARIYNPVGISA
jgi:hypothetical protein